MSAATIERQYVDSRFGQSHLYRAGPLEERGHPPLMCFHMSPWGAVYYEPLLGEMGKDRLALAVDTPGFGNSDAPPSKPSIGDFAAAMGDVVDALKAASLQPDNSEVAMVPSTYTTCDQALAEKIMRLIDALEELDDVQNVYSNADLPESVLDS